MLITIWSVKGGSGVSVVAAGLASVLSESPDSSGGRARCGSLLVDLGSDQPAVLGLATPEGPGLNDWLATPSADSDALRRLEVEVSPSMSLMPTGSLAGPASGAVDEPSWSGEREMLLADLLAEDGRSVVVDGALGAAPARTLAAAGLSLLVVRPCYLALRRAVRDGVRADGVILVEEAGRALDAMDVSRALALPVLCTVEIEASVARAVDAGLLVSRLPRRFVRSLEAIA